MTPSVRRKTDLATLAKRRQKRLEKRRDEAMPLFVATGVADAVEPIPTVREIEVWYRRKDASVFARVLGRERDSLRDWVTYRALAEHYLSIDQVQHMERESARIYQNNTLYRGGYWRSFLLVVGLRDKVQAMDARQYPQVDWSRQKRVHWAGAYMELATGQWESSDFAMAKD